MVSVLSVFWFYKDKPYGDEDILEGPNVCAYGDYAQLNSDHFVIWDKYAREMGINPNAVEYDKIPRGRVLFHIPTHHYIVIASSKIINNADIKDKIMTYYGLPLNTEFRGDEHYR